MFRFSKLNSSFKLQMIHYVGILHFLNFEFLKFRIWEILNFTHLLSTGSTQEDPSGHIWKIVWQGRKESKQTDKNCKTNENKKFTLPISFVLKMLSAFYVCCIYSCALQTRFYHGSKHYEQEQSDLGPICLQQRLSKNINGRESRLQKSWLVGNWLTFLSNRNNSCLSYDVASGRDIRPFIKSINH